MSGPWRRDFDAARDPYSARNALGITIDVAVGYAPISAQYITSTADPALTNERVLTDTASITWDFSTAGQAKANAAGFGNVSNTGTPANDQVAVWTDATHIEGTNGLTFSASGVLTVSNAGYNIVLNPGGGGNVNITADGTPTDVGLLFSTKGAATCNVYTHNYGSIVAAFGHGSISNSNSFVQMWGALNGTPTIASAGGTPNGTVNITGTTLNDNAPSGYIGEYIEATGSSGGISAGTWTAITAITLTPGDWDVWGNTYTNPSGAGLLGAQIYPAPDTADGNTRSSTFAQTPGAGGAASCPIPPVRISISAITTYWINAYSSNGGSVTAYIAARRYR